MGIRPDRASVDRLLGQAEAEVQDAWQKRVDALEHQRLAAADAAHGHLARRRALVGQWIAARKDYLAQLKQQDATRGAEDRAARVATWQERVANFKAPPGIDALPGVYDNDSQWSVFWQYYNWLDGVQSALDVLGMVPGVGEFFNGANALISLARGRWLEAGASLAAMMPILGAYATGGKWSAKTAGELVEHGDDAARLLLHNADDVAAFAARTKPEWLFVGTWEQRLAAQRWLDNAYNEFIATGGVIKSTTGDLVRRGQRLRGLFEPYGPSGHGLPMITLSRGQRWGTEFEELYHFHQFLWYKRVLQLPDHMFGHPKIKIAFELEAEMFLDMMGFARV